MKITKCEFRVYLGSLLPVSGKQQPSTKSKFLTKNICLLSTSYVLLLPGNSSRLFKGYSVSLFKYSENPVVVVIKSLSLRLIETINNMNFTKVHNGYDRCSKYIYIYIYIYTYYILYICIYMFIYNTYNIYMQIYTCETYQ